VRPELSWFCFHQRDDADSMAEWRWDALTPVKEFREYDRIKFIAGGDGWSVSPALNN
jgi:hypothetical protein